MVVLQEVDHHHDWLSPKLAKEGYRSLFVKKPIAPGITFNPHLEDGCSLFYRTGTAALATAPATPMPQESVRRTATTLDLLDAHSFTLAVVEQDDSSGDGDDKGRTGDDGKDQRGGAAGPVAGNQVAIISLLSVSTADGVVDGDGDGRDGRETLVIVTTTHLKAAKTAHGEMIRVRQVSFLFLFSGGVDSGVTEQGVCHSLPQDHRGGDSRGNILGSVVGFTSSGGTAFVSISEPR